jgi:hypothetical protein
MTGRICAALAVGRPQCIGTCHFPAHCDIPEEVRLPIAQSSIDAAVWLNAYHPERLRKWLDDRPGLEEILKQKGVKINDAAMGAASGSDRDRA